MRICMSCLGLSSSQRLPKEDSYHDDHHRDEGIIRSIIEFVKPSCSWTKKSKWKMQHNSKHQYHKLKITKKGTLEDLLVASPGKEEYNSNICASINGGTGESDFFITRFFKRICPPFVEDRADYTSKAREIVSTERLLKVEEVIHSGESEISSLSRSQSGKVRKRVSFKVPSEDDINIFCKSDVESDHSK